MDDCLAQMWHDFRYTIDELVFPKTKKWAERDGVFKVIEADGKAVGFLAVIGGYIEGIYVHPDYRRRGLARKAVLDYIDAGGEIGSLHIVKGNKPAEKFWRSIFILEKDELAPTNPVDTFYIVKGVKRRKKVA